MKPRAPQVFQLSHGQGIAVSVMDWGASWLSCSVPLEKSIREIVLGCPKPEDHFYQPSYLGATVGRFANRIFGARIGREALRLTNNEGDNCLHGGTIGLSRRYWEVIHHDETKISFMVFSAAGEDGFPGNLEVHVMYWLDTPETLTVIFEGELDALCPLSLTNHAYFNLDGANSDVRSHSLSINSNQYLRPGKRLMLLEVAGTRFDYRLPKRIKTDELDHAFLLNQGGFGAQLHSSDGKLGLNVCTDLPALQIYTGNFLLGTPARTGGVYANHAGIAIEPGFLPDSPNNPDWPQASCWFGQNRPYHQSIRYQFVTS